MKYIVLDQEEQALLESYEKGEWKAEQDLKKRIKGLKESAKASINKTKNINIRLSEYVVYKLKAAAIRQGIPYQTLASSILHQYATGQTIKQ